MSIIISGVNFVGQMINVYIGGQVLIITHMNARSVLQQASSNLHRKHFTNHKFSSHYLAQRVESDRVVLTSTNSCSGIHVVPSSVDR